MTKKRTSRQLQTSYKRLQRRVSRQIKRYQKLGVRTPKQKSLRGKTTKQKIKYLAGFSTHLKKKLYDRKATIREQAGSVGDIALL
jgi:hypothetical protein